MRIAILAPSTAPGGTGVHALALGEALCALGHEAVVHAPDPTGRGFFRDARCPVISVAAKPVCDSAAAFIGARIGDYLAHFSTPAACDFDVFHAQCSISGNALATLTRRRLIGGFVRTVHRIETFADAQLARWQDRAIVDAGQLLCVSRSWAAALTGTYGAQAEVIGTGVDGTVFHPTPGPSDAALRARLGLGRGPVFLSVGGFAARKNTLAIIEAFATLHRSVPAAQLVISGAASAPEPTGYEACCYAALEREGLQVGSGRPVICTGPVDQGDMPGLYRLVDTLVIPPGAESSGLCALEATACGSPVIVPARPPYTEYLPPGAALWLDSSDPAVIASAMQASLEPARRARLRNTGRDCIEAQTWAACATRHLPIYAALMPQPTLALPFATGAAAWNVLRMPPGA
ncbi:glycosyltransferase, MSMEG_0565 family [Methylobacterium phyllostachyos]|uniref:Glycosyltransferase, MSMEG_0565 family n=1 Tax=Methylobacterium phyllostachyos TaxID=582672 RepID=A0A1G9WKF4_9HYPH|nr:MSMEG_0565 family glycosyltransferase [Methylobacterium phyllostachyos]SDM85028.1 glycosyltransferase, MSMEG_0565 family [Methylobacterium phyllostachyos]